MSPVSFARQRYTTKAYDASRQVDQAIIDELGWKDRWYMISAIGRENTWPIMKDVMAFFDRQKEEADEAAREG